MITSTKRHRVSSAARWARAATLLLSACAGTETDNPVSKGEPPPPYESPIDLGPSEPAIPPCPPPPDSGKPGELPRWGRDGDVVVGAHPYRGLLRLDASDPLSPQITAELPLDGAPRQLVVEPGLQLSLAIEEETVGLKDTVPEPVDLVPRTRLVRYDASHPRAITRLDAVEIEGELWRMDQRGSTLWVMSAAVSEPRTGCYATPYGCGYVNRTALILRAYTFAQGAWQAGQRVELPMNAQGWVTGDGYASFEAHSDEERTAAGGELHYVRFAADGSLAMSASVPLPGSPVAGTPIHVGPSELRLFVYDYDRGGSELITVAPDSGQELSPRVKIPQQQLAPGTWFGTDAVYVSNANGDGPASLIDLRDPSAPVVTPFPAPYAHVVLLDEDAQGARLIGVGRAAPQTPVRAALLRVQDGVPSVLDELGLEPELDAPDSRSLRREGERVLFSLRSLTDRSWHTGAIEAADTTLRVLGTIPTGYDDDFLMLSDVLYAPDGHGLVVGALGPAPGESERFEWAQEVSAVVAAGDYQASLVASFGQAPRLQLSRDGEVVETFDVGPLPQRLFSDGERLLVLSYLARDQCEQTGLDCGDYAPSVTIVTLGAAPAIAETLPLPDADLIVSDESAQGFIEWWEIPLALGDGRYALVGTLDQQCTTEAACAELGIEPRPIGEAPVNAPAGVPVDCPPGVTSCPQPALLPSPTVFGAKRAQRVYLLDASDSPYAFAPALESVFELENARAAQPLASGRTVLVTRIELEGNPGLGPGGGDPISARFMLDRFELRDDGVLHALPPVNVPGYPLALLGDGARAISLEPDTDTPGANTLHVLKLADDGARSLQTLELPARYGSAVAALGKVFYLQRSGEGCDGSTTLIAVVLPEGQDNELRALPEVTIPGASYVIEDAQQGSLLLGDSQGHHVRIDVAGEVPQVAAFVGLPYAVFEPELDGEALLAPGGLFGVVRAEL